MIINGKTVYVYDVEIFPNCFHVTVYNTENKSLHLFEVSCRKIQLESLRDLFLKTNSIFVGYNNHHYDDLLINYIIEYYNRLSLLSYKDICKSLFNMSQLIIKSEDELSNSIKHFKYAKYFESIDLLTMLFSSKLRVGLKEMQMTMHYPNVYEYGGNFEDYILEKDINEMIRYNINDVLSTAELLTRCQKDIEIRKWIEQEYGLNTYSMDSVKFGETLLEHFYIKATGIQRKTLRNMRSPMDFIPLKDVILPFVKFSNPILQNVLEDMRKQIVSSKEKKSYEKRFVLSNVIYSVGVGGIHSIHKPEIFRPKEDEIIGHADVTSMYPSLLIVYGLSPRHLGENFRKLYEDIYHQRVEAKHNGQKTKNETLKLTLNSVTGKMQQDTSWMYDPFNVFRIRINGQLILLMLVERLLKVGCKIVQVNTDGVMYICKKSSQKAVQDAISDVENITKLNFEVGCYEAFYQYAINDYFGVLEGYSLSNNPKLIEKKGMFIDETELGKGLAPTIIPKAVINYFVKKIPVEETIKQCNDIREFLMGQRVDKEFKVEYMDKQIQRINRFYASTNGAYLYKYKQKGNTKQYINMLTKSGVTILNEMYNTSVKDKKINYRYYISEANKIVTDLRTVQLDLFNQFGNL